MKSMKYLTRRTLAYFALMDSIIARGTWGKRIFREIAHLGVIFPTPLYFESEAGLRVWSYLGIVLLVVYAVSLVISKHGQTVYDRNLRMQVIGDG